MAIHKRGHSFIIAYTQSLGKRHSFHRIVTLRPRFVVFPLPQNNSRRKTRAYQFFSDRIARAAAAAEIRGDPSIVSKSPKDDHESLADRSGS